jgi:hypothetical protein
MSPPIVAQLLVHEVKGQLKSSNTLVSMSSVTERASDDDRAGLQPGWGRGGAGARGEGVLRASGYRLLTGRVLTLCAIT